MSKLFSFLNSFLYHYLFVRTQGHFKYMAARLLDSLHLRAASRLGQNHIDDMESLFHDLVYAMVYYTQIVFTPESLGWWRRYFNEEKGRYGSDCAGSTKIEYMKGHATEGKNFEGLGRDNKPEPIGCTPLRKLVERLGKAFYSRYQWGAYGLSNRDRITQDARDQVKELGDNPYWMAQILTEALTWKGWPEEGLLKLVYYAESIDWGQVAKEMQERSEKRRPTRKRRRLH